MGGVVWSQPGHLAEATPANSVETPNETVTVTEGNLSDLERKAKLEENMRKFKEEMDQKREARKEAIHNLNKRIIELQEERNREHNEKLKLKEELEKLKAATVINVLTKEDKVNCDESSVHGPNQSEREGIEVAQSQEEQGETTEVIEIRNEQSSADENFMDEHDKDEVIEGLERQVKALKDVAVIGGEMLRIRELQVNELKSKLEAIEETGIAYEKEVENMKKLRNLYEERARAMTISHEMELEREKQKTLAAETRQKLAEHRNSDLEEKNKEIEERMGKIEKELDDAKLQISDLKIKLAGKNEDLYNATSQLAVVNHLFGQLVSPGQDSLEKITKVLEENHDLVNHLTANGKINELASTLVDIADKDPLPVGEENDMSGHLTKVWRLLVELLGHHIVKPVPEEASPESCYKSVDTPSGPKLVISVSQTFLRLKDLILEKNSLMKEVGRLKDLNSTLESRLVEQESRLSLVTTELHTTWAVVNKLKRQHQNLHSHEQVLRYELAQKRLLLNDLKKQLEECKDNWSLARAKNNQTEKDWKLLRSEFALRKQQASSAESGYEESPTDSQDEEEWKETKNQSVSSNEDHCEVLSWNVADEPRTDRRGTLTNVVENDETSSRFMDFTVDEVDPCTVLPWTETEDSLVEHSPPDRIPNEEAPAYLSNVQTHQLSAPGDGLLPIQASSTSSDNHQSSIVSVDELGTAMPSQTEYMLHFKPPLTPSDAQNVGISNSNSGYDEPGGSGTSSKLTEPLPSTSRSEPSASQPRQRTAEEILQARQDRLRRLEEGCKGLFNKMSQTNQRSEIIKSRLTELHEIYGEESRTHRGPSDDAGSSTDVCTALPESEPEPGQQTSLESEAIVGTENASDEPATTAPTTPTTTLPLRLQPHSPSDEDSSPENLDQSNR